MSKYQAGDIVLIEIPFTDLSGTKKRPACVLSAHGEDCLVAFLTSRLEQARRGDVVLKKSPANGLAVDSAVLVDKLFTSHVTLIERKLGVCSPMERRAVITAVIEKLKLGL
jgi:mRNA interferase MazF